MLFFARRLNYLGSFQDWVNNGGSVVLPNAQNESQSESPESSESKENK